ncbi:MAG: diguanylate cyclase [Rhodospirillales bacterium]|nr:diguanylate cyclase [Rhodospirillales bacterium]
MPFRPPPTPAGQPAGMPVGRPPGARPAWLAARQSAGLFAVVLAAAAIGVALSRTTGGIAALWLANGLTIAALLQGERAQWPALLAGGLAGILLADVAMGIGVPASLGYVASNGVEIVTAAALLRWRLGGAPDLTAPRNLAAFVLAGPLAAAAISAALTGALLAALPDAPGLPILGRWYVGHALGMAVMVPLGLMVLRREAVPLFATPLLARTLALLGGYAALLAVIFTQARLPLLFVPFPALLVVVAVLGAAGGTLAVLLTAGIALVGTLLDHGPLMLMPGATLPQRVGLLQLFIVMAAAMAFAVGAIVQERRRLTQMLVDQHARLAGSERLYRLLADHASDIISRIRLDGTRLYISPSVEEVLGWSVEEMMRPDWQKNVHPDDLERFTSVREALRNGAEQMRNTYRFRRKNGEWAWIEGRLSVVRGADGQPVESVGVLRDVTRQKETELALELAMMELAEQAATDGLTGLANRRRFDEALEREWRRAARAGETVALLMIDADHFKAFNDRHGHQAGDDCLRIIADCIAASIRRPHDLAARYGGEEFAVILPATVEAGAARIAGRICTAVSELNLAHAGAGAGHVTVSIGLACATPGSETTPAALLESADQALYAAKAGGRNRVEPGSAAPQRVVALSPAARRAAS